MEFTINSSVLLGPLQDVSGALSDKVKFPILEGILFRVDNSGLYLQAGDGTTMIGTAIDSNEFTPVSFGEVVLAGKVIVGIIGKLSGEIHIQSTGMQVLITSGRAEFEVTGLDAEEYPKMPSDKSEEITISGELFKTMINKTVFAVSDKTETPILMGVKLEFSTDQIKMIATDRHRFSSVKKNIENSVVAEAVIDGAILKKLSKIITGDVRLSFSYSQFFTRTGKHIFYSGILEGSYPDLSNAIPHQFNGSVIVERSKLIKSMDRVHFIAKSEDGKVKLAKMVVGKDLELSSKPEGSKRVVESLEYSRLVGDQIKFSFNVEYMLAALKVIDEELVQISYTNTTSPIIVRGLDNERETQLILPYRTTD